MNVETKALLHKGNMRGKKNPNYCKQNTNVFIGTQQCQGRKVLYILLKRVRSINISFSTNYWPMKRFVFQYTTMQLLYISRHFNGTDRPCRRKNPVRYNVKVKSITIDRRYQHHSKRNRQRCRIESSSNSLLLCFILRRIYTLPYY